MRNKMVFILAVSLYLFQSCRDKSDSALGLTDLVIDIQHCVDGKPLVFDSLVFQNEAGELYEVSTLKYYISTIRCYKNGSQVFLVDTVLYIDARKSNSFKIEKMPVGTYDSILVNVGVDSRFNYHGGLVATVENINMQWPEGMGGGFHFLKLEGHFDDGRSLPGFAVHLGTNAYLVSATLSAIPDISGIQENRLTLKMDVNKWFAGPHTYSFAGHGGYTMGDPDLMKVIADNGRDVFSLTGNN